MSYQNLVDSLSVNINVEDVSKNFYENVRRNLPDKIYKYYSLNDNTSLQLL